MDVFLNWLWQGGVVALAAAAALRAISPNRAQARYYVMWAACIAVLALPAMPLIWAAASLEQAVGSGLVSGASVVSMPIAWWTSTATAGGLWVVWSSVCAGRVLVATVALLRAKKDCRELPAALEARLRHWTRVNTTGRRSRVMLSDRVSAAAVLGGWRPVIAIAPSLLEHLSDAELDRVVIHEWAHVQRRDDVAQVAQLVVRVIAGWHPAMWWLERQLQLEREVACDETAVAVTGSAKEYAACLVTLAGLPGIPLRRLPALAAGSSSALRRRIVRVLSARHVASAQTLRPIVIIAAVLLAVLAGVVGTLRVVETATFVSEVISTTPTGPAATIVAPALITSHPTPDIRRPGLSTGFGSRRSDRETQPAKHEDAGTRGTEVATRMTVEPQAAPVAAQSAPLRPQSDESATSAPVVTHGPLALAVSALPDIASEPAVAASPSAAGAEATAAWGGAVDAGKALGRSSERAAAATADFFTRFGKQIAGSF